MTGLLKIKNFKSIRELSMPCKKINVFIGEPNSGKSNIIEALAMMSQGVIGQEISKEVVRYKSIGDLFFDFNINKPIDLFTEEMNYKFSYSIREDGVPDNQFNFELKKNLTEFAVLNVDHNGKIINLGTPVSTVFRYYQYKRLANFTLGYMPHLSPPFGENLPSLLLSNEDFRNWTTDFFESKGFTLTQKPAENEISISKFVNKSIYSYPYLSVSETLQRIVFYSMAIQSNKNSILLFDEPESNTFPFYTKFLAEKIALDETNQFFLTTHNPYLLMSLIEKSNNNNINVCVARMKNYETEVIVLNSRQLEEVLDFNSDVFFNLDRITD